MNWYWWVSIFAGTPIGLAVGLLVYMRFFQPSGQMGVAKRRFDLAPSFMDKLLFLLFWPEIWILGKLFDRMFED